MSLTDYDIIVAGGGISGAIAGIAAARCGARSLVVEKYGFLGGMLTAGGVGPMMTFHAGNRQVIKGITSELVDRLASKGYSTGHIPDTIGYTYTVTPFDAEWMKHELEIMLLESGGEVLYHTMLAGVEVDKDEIDSIVICNKAGLSKIKARVYVDATGDADLSAWSGVGFSKGREGDGKSQPMTMIFKMVNVDIDAVKKYVRENMNQFPLLKGDAEMIDKAPRLSLAGFDGLFSEAREIGEISFKREYLLFFETNIPGEVIINTSRVLLCDSTLPDSLSRAEAEGRRQVRELAEFLNNKVPGFENARVVCSGPSIGVRSSRQIEGLYTLTAADLLECRKFNDVIAHSGYPIDIHNPDGEGNMEREKTHLNWGDYYGIPFRCLVNNRINNLVTVGRCISATFEAQAAIRLSPTAGATGHAGGVAAYIAARDAVAVKDISIKELQQILMNQGAFIDI